MAKMGIEEGMFWAKQLSPIALRFARSLGDKGAMAEPAPPPQPMDEILASIRRIIQEEPPIGAPAAAAPAPNPAVIEDDDEVLELGDAPSRPATPEPAPLLSGTAQVASRQALAALTGVSIDPNASANTLDGLVREMLRPMLKDWLDANLPELVERLVAREIARIGGR